LGNPEKGIRQRIRKSAFPKGVAPFEKSPRLSRPKIELAFGILFVTLFVPGRGDGGLAALLVLSRP